MADLGTDMGEFCPRTAVAERTIHSTPKKEKKKEITILVAYTQKIDQSGWGWKQMH